MRILLSAYAFEPNAGSEPGYGWNWAHHLTDGGHEVVVLTSDRAHARIENHLATGGPTVEYVTVPTMIERRLRGEAGVYAHYAIWQRRALTSARRLLKQRPFDVVHHVTWGSLHLGSHMGRLGIPFLFGPVGGGQTAPEVLRPFYAGNWKTEAVRSFVTRNLMRFDRLATMAVRKAQTVLVSNEETAHLARRLGASRVRYFPENGVTADRMLTQMPQTVKAGPLRLLWIARLYARKGLPLALRALKAVSEDVDATLSIVGYGPLEDQVNEWIADLGLQDRVVFLGAVPWERLAWLYESSDALLFTSIRDSTGAQLLEAMGYGLPIVTLDHHGASVLVPDDAGIKVPVQTAGQVVAGLADAITALAVDRDLRLKLSRSAWQFASSQRWKEKAEAMTRQYEVALKVASGRE